VRDVGRPLEASPAEDPLGQGQASVDDVHAVRDLDALAGDERVHPLGRRPEAEADLPVRPRGERDPGRLQEPLRVDDDVGRERAQRRQEGAELSARFRRERLPPPRPRRRGEGLVDVGSSLEETGERPLHGPREPVALAAERLREREREDDVAEGGKAYEQNLHARFAILTSWCSTRRFSS
jgi:hypothetical protein